MLRNPRDLTNAQLADRLTLIATCMDEVRMDAPIPYLIEAARRLVERPKS